MSANAIIKSIEDAQIKEVADFNVGDTIKVYAKIKEGNRERVQAFEGTVLKRQGGSCRETFTVRKNSNGVGVEKTWPVNSPLVEKVDVVRRGKARRAKLYYLRDRVGKRAKVKEIVKEEELVEPVMIEVQQVLINKYNYEIINTNIKFDIDI